MTINNNNNNKWHNHHKRKIYSIEVELDRDLIEREMVGRKMTDDEWMEICEELDDTMYDDKMKILLQHTWVGDEYHNRYGAVMY